mmetsp:Transcript_14745/g.43253  ORF Transcript_14745/g.43253 Transcript_14745/m.43253 type:complete len:256 (+) Transcript_14745:2132-2899(+)
MQDGTKLLEHVRVRLLQARRALGRRRREAAAEATHPCTAARWPRAVDARWPLPRRRGAAPASLGRADVAGIARFAGRLAVWRARPRRRARCRRTLAVDGRQHVREARGAARGGEVANAHVERRHDAQQLRRQHVQVLLHTQLKRRQLREPLAHMRADAASLLGIHLGHLWLDMQVRKVDLGAVLVGVPVVGLVLHIGGACRVAAGVAGAALTGPLLRCYNHVAVDRHGALPWQQPLLLQALHQVPLLKIRLDGLG